MVIRVVSAESMKFAVPTMSSWYAKRCARNPIALGFGLVDQTKVVTASSELARNTLDYGGGGTVHLGTGGKRHALGLAAHF